MQYVEYVTFQNHPLLIFVFVFYSE